MRALTLLQPWATLVAIEAKQIETRSWYTKYRGPLAIHASKSFPASARECCRERPFEDALVRAGYGTTPRWYDAPSVDTDRLPLGVLLAVANLVAVGEIYHRRSGEVRVRGVEWTVQGKEWRLGDYDAGRYAWVLADVRRLAIPIPCRGALGLWKLPEDVGEQMEAALRR